MTYKVKGTVVVDASGNINPGDKTKFVVNDYLEFADLPTTPEQGSVSGYSSGGRLPASTVIDKFPFASDANATDVGNLTDAVYGAAGQQV